MKTVESSASWQIFGRVAEVAEEAQGLGLGKKLHRAWRPKMLAGMQVPASLFLPHDKSPMFIPPSSSLLPEVSLLMSFWR